MQTLKLKEEVLCVKYRCGVNVKTERGGFLLVVDCLQSSLSLKVHQESVYACKGIRKRSAYECFGSQLSVAIVHNDNIPMCCEHIPVVSQSDSS